MRLATRLPAPEALLMASRWRARFAEANFWLARFLEPRCIVRIQRDRYPESGQTPARDGTARIHVVVPVHGPLKTLRETLCGLCLPRRCGASYWGERSKSLLGAKPSCPFHRWEQRSFGVKAIMDRLILWSSYLI